MPKLSQTVLRTVMEEFERRHDGVLDARLLEAEIRADLAHPWRKENGGEIEMNDATAAIEHRVGQIFKLFRRARVEVSYHHVILNAPRNVPIIDQTPRAYEHILRAREVRSEENRRQIVAERVEKLAREVRTVRILAAVLDVTDQLGEIERRLTVFGETLRPSVNDAPAGNA